MGPGVSEANSPGVTDLILGSYLRYPGTSEEANALSPRDAWPVRVWPLCSGAAPGVCAEGIPVPAPWGSEACRGETGSSLLQGCPRMGVTDLRIPRRSPDESTSLPEGSGQSVGPRKEECAELCSLPAGYRRAADLCRATAETAVPLKACTWEA